MDWLRGHPVALVVVVVRLGPNGAGKTTKIEILEGFRAPSAGRVLVLVRVTGEEDPLHAGEAWRARKQSGSQVSTARDRVMNRGY